MRELKWGVMCHYLPETTRNDRDIMLDPEEWNRQVVKFDVEALALQLEEIGAGYLLFTIGQNSGYYCSPNAIYDDITGIKPSKCSDRDLIGDLCDALAARNVKFFAYLPSGAPVKDLAVVEKLGWLNLGLAENSEKNIGKRKRRLAEFQQKWEAVVREWSLRWGSRVAGWWIDGCYYSYGSLKIFAVCKNHTK